jgi:hypothetical protein
MRRYDQMQASIKTNTDGSLVLNLDDEAARAVFASVLFAARFHEGIKPLVKVAREALAIDVRKSERRPNLCR